MSQVCPIPVREPVGATPRRGFSPARRKALLERQGPSCAIQGCERPWLEADHILPLALGGPDTMENIEGLCGAHHLGKTRADIERVWKAKAQAGETGHGYKRPIGRRADFQWPSRKLQNRGFR